MSLAGAHRGGSLVTASDPFLFEVQGLDDLSISYQISNWLSGITSGALYAFRALKIQRRGVYLSELQGKLSSADMDAVANSAAMAIALLSGKESPTLDLAGWAVRSEILGDVNGNVEGK